MPKKSKMTLVQRGIALARRNPLATIASLVGIFAGIPSAALGLNYALTAAEPAWVAQRYWVRDHTDERLSPLAKELRTRTTELDYLILKEQRKALTEAKDDLKRDPNSTSAPNVIERLQKSIETREKRLDDATKNRK